MNLKGTVKNATNTVIRALAPGSHAEPGVDILDTLQREHDEVKALLAQLTKATTAARRRSLTRRIAAALVPHTKAEEKVLYSAILGLQDKTAQVDGHEGYLEHGLASRTLQRLLAIKNANSAEHWAAAKVLKELVEHHIDEEEGNTWRDAKEHFSDEDRERMNIAYLAAKRRVTLA
jgi:hemerythrin-like domain-containing protein